MSILKWHLYFVVCLLGNPTEIPILQTPACVEVLFYKGEIPAEIPLNSEPLVHWHFRILIPRDLQARRRVTILALTMISTIIINGMPLSLLHHSTFFAACTADGQILCFSVIISCVANPVFSGLVHHTLTLEVSLINFSPFWSVSFKPPSFISLWPLLLPLLCCNPAVCLWVWICPSGVIFQPCT